MKITDLASKPQLVKITLDEEELVKKYGIKTIPSFILLSDDGGEVKRNVGSMTEGKLLQFINEEFSE